MGYSRIACGTGCGKGIAYHQEDIGKTISVAEYNAACRKDVMKFTKEWTDLTHKMGYWVEFGESLYHL